MLYEQSKTKSNSFSDFFNTSGSTELLISWAPKPFKKSDLSGVEVKAVTYMPSLFAYEIARWPNPPMPIIATFPLGF